MASDSISIGVWVAAISAFASCVTLFFQSRSWRNQSVLSSQEIWKFQRQELSTSRFRHTAVSFYLNDSQYETLIQPQQIWPAPNHLTTCRFPEMSVIEGSLDDYPGRGFSLLTRKEWALASPILLSPDDARTQLGVRLLTDRHSDSDYVKWKVRPIPTEVKNVLPFRLSKPTFGKVRYAKYSDAVNDLAPPGMWENRICYRVCEINLTSAQPSIILDTMNYFDSFDEGEAVNHEWHIASGKKSHANLRKKIGDPTLLGGRNGIGAVSAVTIVNYEGNPKFLLHERNVTNVATSRGMKHVVPSGVFQPASISEQSRELDADIWKSMIREYAEEILGKDEARYLTNDVIDYSSVPPYRTFQQLGLDGHFNLYLLGVGINPTNLVVEFLLAGVFDETAKLKFGTDWPILASRQTTDGSITSGRMEEGRFVPGKTGIELDFDLSTIDALTQEPGQMSSASVACLRLALHFRTTILAKK